MSRSSVHVYYQMTHKHYIIGGCGDKNGYIWIHSILKIPFLRECLLLSDKSKNVNSTELANNLEEKDIINGTIKEYSIKYIILDKENKRFYEFQNLLNNSVGEHYEKTYEDETILAYKLKNTS